MAASDYEVFDERFRSCVNRTSHVERLWTGARWTEGPVYFPAGRYTLFSDIPNDRIMRYDETDGSVSVFRSPCGYTNGHTVDRQGRLVSCEHGGRRVSRTEHDGRITVIADSYNGKRLNSPNDVVVKSDGSIWFTDPPYGILSDYEGHKSDSEVGACHVYRIDPQTGDVRIVADDFVRPNGIAFSPDERRLYVVDTGATHVADGPRHIRVFDVDDITRSAGELQVSGRVGIVEHAGLHQTSVCPGAYDGLREVAPQGVVAGVATVVSVVDRHIVRPGLAEKVTAVTGLRSRVPHDQLVVDQGLEGAGHQRAVDERRRSARHAGD